MNYPTFATPYLGIALRPRLPIAIVACLQMAAAAPTSAQGVVGHLYDFDTGVAVSAADVMMANQAGDTVGRAVSNAAGGFVILVDALGEYTLSISRLGYRTQVTKISIEDATLEDLTFMIHPDAVGIDGLVVSTKPKVNWLSRQGFYERRTRAIGEFVQPTETEKLQAFNTSGFLRSVPGLRLGGGGVRTLRGGSGLNVGPCPLKIFVNGIDVGFDLDGAVISRHVLAIEVYKSLHNVPAPYVGTAAVGMPGSGARQSCGAVLVWTEVGGG